MFIWEYSSKKIYTVYTQIYDVFGDSFSNQIKLKNRIISSNKIEAIKKHRIKLREIKSIQNDEIKTKWFEKSEIILRKKIIVKYGKPIEKIKSNNKITEEKQHESIKQFGGSNKIVLLKL